MLLNQLGYLSGRGFPRWTVIGIMGDSKARGNSDDVGPTPVPNTVYQWDAGNSNLRMITNLDLLEPVADGAVGSQWPQCGISFYQETGSKPIFVNCGVGGSAFNNTTASASWNTNGTLFSNAVTKINNACAYVGKSRPDIVYVGLGTNDIVQLQALSQSYVQSLVDRIQTEWGSDVRICMGSPGFDSGVILTYANFQRQLDIKNWIKQEMLDNTNVEICLDEGNFQQWGGMYQGDDIHLNETGNVFAGVRIARGFAAGQHYHRYTRAIISSLYSDPSHTRRAWLDAFIRSQDAAGNLARLDGLHIYGGMGEDAASKYKNGQVDWAFLQSSGYALTTTQGDSYVDLNGTDQYVSNAINITIRAHKMTIASDFIHGVFIGTNSVPAGTLGSLFGVRESAAGGIILLRQTASSNISFFGGSTSGSTYSGETAFASDSHYAIVRSSGNQILIKNASVLQTSAVAAVALNPAGNLRSPTAGAYNANGSLADYMNVNIKADYDAVYSTLDLTSFYNDMNTLMANWLTSTR